jgi:hypothetical protein
MTKTPQPTKPIDCFTDEEKRWAVERLKEAYPDAWEVAVRAQANNMKFITLTEEETPDFAREGVYIGRFISTLPLDYGSDGWDLNREHVIFRAYFIAAEQESKKRFSGGQ